MPFVNVQIGKGNSKAFEGEIAQRIMADISEHAGLPPEAVWIALKGGRGGDWRAGSKRVCKVKNCGAAS